MVTTVVDMARAGTTTQVYERCSRAGERFEIVTEFESYTPTNQDDRGRRRRASTGSVMGTGRHPPSEVESKTASGRSRMQRKFTASVWAMLSVGLEAESEEWERAFDLGAVEGVCLRERWRNYDGERRWRWTDKDGTPCARSWRLWLVQRMVGMRRGGQWRGEWVWEAYDRDREWNEGLWLSANRRWLDMGNVHQSATAPGRGVDVPVEVLRYMLEAFDWVCAALSLTTQGSHFLISDRRNGLRDRARRECSPQ